MFEIRLDKQAEHFMSKCENEIFDRITAKLEALKHNPVPHDAKRVIGYELPTFRIRVGKYRSLYRVIGKEINNRTILFLSIKGKNPETNFL